MHDFFDGEQQQRQRWAVDIGTRSRHDDDAPCHIRRYIDSSTRIVEELRAFMQHSATSSRGAEV
jgi:hypothetical protein